MAGLVAAGYVLIAPWLLAEVLVVAGFMVVVRRRGGRRGPGPARARLR
ncbi:hypothetical protein AB0K35_25785 [Micromonospora sp. NPDC053740]